MKKKALRVRHVAEGQRCRVDGKVFFPQRTISGRSTETVCSPECAMVSMQAREKAASRAEMLRFDDEPPEQEFDEGGEG